MVQSLRLTVADLANFPMDDGNRYELIDGELHVSTQPDIRHQLVAFNVGVALGAWNAQTRPGYVIPAPGVIFSEDNAVAPDVVWVSRERMSQIMGEDGKLHDAPELMVEVLSPGSKNERRDREAKLGLYARRGVQEYWIVDWRRREVAVYRREPGSLGLVATLTGQDVLRSPLLPGFEIPVGTFFADLPGTASG